MWGAEEDALYISMRTCTYYRSIPNRLRTLDILQLKDIFIKSDSVGISSHVTFQELNAAQRRGVAIETSKKMMAGGNRQHHAAKNTARL